MRSIDKLIANLPDKVAAAVMHKREIHSCLMGLSKTDSQRLARKAIYINYIKGEGRMLGETPRSYKVADRRGGFVERETYFHYINKVH